MDHPMQELKLNVSYFYRDEESRQLITAEETTQGGFDEDSECFMRGEKVYECWFGFRRCRMSRSSLLAMSLFCTLAVAVVMITVVLLCTFISLSNTSNSEESSHDDVVGVINWLHYPVGDLTIRRNHTFTHV